VEEPVIDEASVSLSFSSVCASVAEELGLSASDVRSMGLTSVDEWRANFEPAAWARVCQRALTMEKERMAESKAQAAMKDKQKEQRVLNKIANRDYVPKADPLNMPSAYVNSVNRSTQGAARRAANVGQAPAARRPLNKAPGAGRPSRPLRQGEGAKEKVLSTSNRFAGMLGDGDNSDD
jgi:hypothetical protein